MHMRRGWCAWICASGFQLVWCPVGTRVQLGPINWAIGIVLSIFCMRHMWVACIKLCRRYPRDACQWPCIPLCSVRILESTALCAIHTQVCKPILSYMLEQQKNWICKERLTHTIMHKGGSLAHAVASRYVSGQIFVKSPHPACATTTPLHCAQYCALVCSGAKPH